MSYGLTKWINVEEGLATAEGTRPQEPEQASRRRKLETESGCALCDAVRSKMCVLIASWN